MAFDPLGVGLVLARNDAKQASMSEGEGMEHLGWPGLCQQPAVCWISC